MWRALSGDCSWRMAIFALFGCIGFSSPSSAVEFSGTYQVEAWRREPGLVVQTAKVAESLDFVLDRSNSVYAVDLFDIWTDEPRVSLGQDLAGQVFKVGFLFDAPAFSGTVVGQTRGEAYNTGVLGALFGGRGILQWLPGPEVLSFGDGGAISVALTESYFNAGIGSGAAIGGFALTPGRERGARIRATFTLVSEPVSQMPIPTALPLLASAVGGLFVVARRSRIRA